MSKETHETRPNPRPREAVKEELASLFRPRTGSFDSIAEEFLPFPTAAGTGEGGVTPDIVLEDTTAVHTHPAAAQSTGAAGTTVKTPEWVKTGIVPETPRRPTVAAAQGSGSGLSLLSMADIRRRRAEIEEKKPKTESARAKRKRSSGKPPSAATATAAAAMAHYHTGMGFAPSPKWEGEETGVVPETPEDKRKKQIKPVTASASAAPTMGIMLAATGAPNAAAIAEFEASKATKTPEWKETGVVPETPRKPATAPSAVTAAAAPAPTEYRRCGLGADYTQEGRVTFTFGGGSGAVTSHFVARPPTLPGRR